jgi:hypothetical protein
VLHAYRKYAIQEHDIVWLNHYIRFIGAEKIRFSVHCRDSQNDPTELSSTEPILVSSLYDSSNLYHIPTTTGVLRITTSPEVIQTDSELSWQDAIPYTHMARNAIVSELSWQVDEDSLQSVIISL